ncbi:hypothetical protein [Mesorhizobium norvegicum]|uniref:hypothetical protein n=1 Tax=Mesorhizobium sp. 10.2.3 TaxID=1085775 RepID=UPI00319DD353
MNVISWRNTADAFLKELLHYNFIEYLSATQDGRIRPIQPTVNTLDTLAGWLMAHLHTLDSLDGANCLATFLERPDAPARVQPLVADGLISSSPLREPKQTFSLFSWLNNGGVVMDWLISGVDPDHAGLAQIPTGIVSIGDFAKWLKLSRTHLARKLRDAEDLGSVGWLGQRGHSVMWVSGDFYQEYMTAQAVKLAIIDAAFETGLPPAAAGDCSISSRAGSVRIPQRGMRKRDMLSLQVCRCLRGTCSERNPHEKNL